MSPSSGNTSKATQTTGGEVSIELPDTTGSPREIQEMLKDLQFAAKGVKSRATGNDFWP